MSAPDWVDGDEAVVVADRPFHAGVAQDLVRGNLLRAQEQSGYDLCALLFDGDSTITHTPSSSGDFELLSEFVPMVLPLRKKQESDDWRTLTVFVDGKTSGGTATVRAYLTRAWNPTVDATGGILGVESYAEVTLTGAGFAVDSDTVTPADYWSRSHADTGVSYPFVYLILLVSNTTTDDVTIKSVRVTEAPV